MAAYLHHAARSRSILHSAAAAVGVPVRSFFCQGNAYVASRDPHEADHFTWLQNFAPNLKFESVRPESWPALLQREGPWAINSLLIFPNDGMVSPAFFSECQRALGGQQGEGAMPAHSRLVELLLGEGEGGEVRVQGAVMMLPDGSERIVTTDHVVVSLGPGACLKIEPPLLRERLADLLLAGSGLEVAIMAPSVVVRWLLNKVKLDGCDLRCWLSSSHLS